MIHLLGRCASCYSITLLVEASYIPGFTADLTWWRAGIFDDNTICQMIRWCARNKRRCYECRSLDIDGEAVDRIVDTGSRIDLNAIRPHEEAHDMITDASSIELFLARPKKRITLAPCIGYYDMKNIKADSNWCSTFRDIWYLVRDSLPRDLNPYDMGAEEPCVESRRKGANQPVVILRPGTGPVVVPNDNVTQSLKG